MPAQISDLLKKICSRETADYPIIEMEKLIAFGEMAVAPIIGSLECEKGFPKPEDELPLLVMLGEIRSPTAIPILIEYLKNVEHEVYAAIACESLAKIGTPSLSALRSIVRDEKNSLVRLYAYGALGYMKTADAHDLLLEQLGVDRDLVNVIALTLSEHKRKEDSKILYGFYEGPNDALFYPDIEEAIRYCSSEENISTYIEEDWRTRYRRLPNYGWVPELSDLQLMAIGHEAVLENPELLVEARKGLKKFSLNEILSGKKRFEAPKDKSEWCEDCGERLRNEFGIKVCSDTSDSTKIYQISIMQICLKEGLYNIPQAFDFLGYLFDRGSQEKKRKNKDWFLDVVKVGYATFDYFVESRIYDLKEAEQKILKVIKIRWKEFDPEVDSIPFHRIDVEPPEPIVSAKIGRNEPCTCRSGKKYKKCCGK